MSFYGKKEVSSATALINDLKSADLVPFSHETEPVTVQSLSEVRLAMFQQTRDEDASALATLEEQQKELEDNIAHLNACIAASDAALKCLEPKSAHERLREQAGK